LTTGANDKKTSFCACGTCRKGSAEAASGGSNIRKEVVSAWSKRSGGVFMDRSIPVNLTLQRFLPGNHRIALRKGAAARRP
jgi:hypothetical protein